MSQQDEPKVIKKKVSPYPISVQLEGFAGKIVKLTTTGFLVETSQPLQVNKVYESQFILPVMNVTVVFKGIVVKTYDRFRGGLGESQANLKLAEISFKSLGSGNKEQINHFMVKIGQKR